ncbi:MAG TPA: c-type cytochrome, partial [Candidatus Binataceae bacterium]|nr:c-type cytochrome [Candidatus Binataceae bacterium]
RRLLEFLVVAVLGAAIAAAVLLFLVLPRLQWNATTRPSAGESWVARYVLGKWVRANARDEHNPISPTADNLRDGEHEYDERCAVCHGLDGNAQNGVRGDFYPPIPRLSRGAKFLTDGQVYFIVSNGIRMSAMPGFGTRHSPDELWKIILWVRHLPDLSPQERASIQARSQQQENGEPVH